ncbi:MAG: LOG family protein [Phycisphaeraceae bacterium]|nr:MAG: LOG family protein [Phycisphaeraceae bacterium]
MQSDPNIDGRPEIQATETTDPPRRRARPRMATPEMADTIDKLIQEMGADPESYDGGFIRDLMATSLKLISDGRNSGELKLMAAALKEMRHSYRIFAQYPDVKKISIFGSARTPPEHPDYITAVEFSRIMADDGWLVITGAGDGIMKAGHEGPGRESSFGLSIRLPFETTANEIIAGDSKLINFRYFFTRKLMFVSQADAVVCFPGGFGTQDETFEVLTLVQTGKSAIVPVVLIEGEGSGYWQHWLEYVQETLLGGGFISDEDQEIFYIAPDASDAAKHIDRFYRNYHSSRYVRDDLVIRVNQRLRDEDIAELEREFKPLIREGEVIQRGPLDVEDDHPELPRIVFTHTRRSFGLVRRLINRINDFDPA